MKQTENKNRDRKVGFIYTEGETANYARIELGHFTNENTATLNNGTDVQFDRVVAFGNIADKFKEMWDAGHRLFNILTFDRVRKNDFKASSGDIITAMELVAESFEPADALATEASSEKNGKKKKSAPSPV